MPLFFHSCIFPKSLDILFFIPENMFVNITFCDTWKIKEALLGKLPFREYGCFNVNLTFRFVCIYLGYEIFNEFVSTKVHYVPIYLIFNAKIIWYNLQCLKCITTVHSPYIYDLHYNNDPEGSVTFHEYHAHTIRILTKSKQPKKSTRSFQRHVNSESIFRKF